MLSILYQPFSEQTAQNHPHLYLGRSPKIGCLTGIASNVVIAASYITQSKCSVNVSVTHMDVTCEIEFNAGVTSSGVLWPPEVS